MSEQEDDDFDLPDLLEASDSEASDDEMEIDNEEVSRDLFTPIVLTARPDRFPSVVKDGPAPCQFGSIQSSDPRCCRADQSCRQAQPSRHG